MYLMLDIVTNHMGFLGCGECVDYSIFKPFNTVCFHPVNDCRGFCRYFN